jgi:hypothetical protein
MGERHASAEERAAHLQAQVGSVCLLSCCTPCKDAAVSTSFQLVSRGHFVMHKAQYVVVSVEK